MAIILKANKVNLFVYSVLFVCLYVAAIQERVKAVLRLIPKEAFSDSFQKLYERCQKCVLKDGDYFEGQ
jgi:hypothetical protein